jgi:hypothetical protein
MASVGIGWAHSKTIRPDAKDKARKTACFQPGEENGIADGRGGRRSHRAAAEPQLAASAKVSLAWWDFLG